MKRVNFNALNNIKAPEALIERTLAAAQEHPADAEPADHRVLPLRYRRMIAAAAGVVLVTAIGLSVYFLNRNFNNQPIAVAPATAATLVPTEPATLPASAVPTQPTFDPTAMPTAPATDQPTEPSVAPTAPAIVPTEKQTEPTEKPTVPVEDPTKPTEDERPDEPTALPIRDEPVILYGSLTDEIRLNAKYVCCRIETEDGQPLGDEDLYSAQHRVTVIRAYRTVQYDPTARGLELSAGDYHYYFYEENGTIFDEGEIHID